MINVGTVVYSIVFVFTLIENIEAEEIITLNQKNTWVYSVAFSPDGKTFASAAYGSNGHPRKGEVKLWDLGTAKDRESLLRDIGFSSVVFSPDGKILVGGTDDGNVIVWDVLFSKEIITLKGTDCPLVYGGFFSSVVLSPNGKILATAYIDLERPKSEIKLWNTTNFKYLGSLKCPGQIFNCSLAFSPDGNTLATASFEDKKECNRSFIHLWNVWERKIIATFQGRKEHVYILVKYSPDGKTLALSEGEGGDEDLPVIKILDLPSGKVQRTLKGHEYYPINSLAFSPDGHTIASGASGATSSEVKLWETSSGGERASIQFDALQLMSVAFSPDGKTIALGGYAIEAFDKFHNPEKGHGEVKLWNIEKLIRK